VFIKQNVTFSPQSDLPAVEGCVDAVLLIGRAIRMRFPAFLDALEANARPSCYEVLRVLANILAREMQAKNITDITHARDVWREFAASPTVRKLSGPGSLVIREIGRRIAADAVSDNAGMGKNILWAANLKAARWVKERILTHLQDDDIVPDVEFGTAPLVIDYDEAGTQFCASSSPLLWEIHWTLQPFEHSLFGAMTTPRILEHEYVSHLLPKNQCLSMGVREVFLVDTLEEEHRNDVEESPRNRAAEMKLDSWFRTMLEQHFYRAHQASRTDLRDFEEVAVRLRRRSASDFWKMTAEILRLPDGPGDAQMVDSVIRLLRPCPDRIVDELTIPWLGFGKCLELARMKGYK
jgi:hypothetical protein